jgi:four helix bundle protein
MSRIDRIEDLHVYATAYAAAMEIFEHSKGWTREERYALTDRIRRSSRAVCANLAEAWAKRRYPAHSTSKLSDAYAEAEETLTWLRFASDCGYARQDWADSISGRYHAVAAGLLRMMNAPGQWAT